MTFIWLRTSSSAECNALFCFLLSRCALSMARNAGNLSPRAGTCERDAMKGVILAGRFGHAAYPVTHGGLQATAAGLRQPMIYYPLSHLMFAVIREFLIITTPQDRPLFERLLGDGSDWGLQFSFAAQPSPARSRRRVHRGGRLHRPRPRGAGPGRQHIPRTRPAGDLGTRRRQDIGRHHLWLWGETRRSNTAWWSSMVPAGRCRSRRSRATRNPTSR